MASPNELTVNFDSEGDGGAPTRPDRRVSRPRLNIPVLRLSSVATSPPPPGSPVITIPLTPIGGLPKGQQQMGMLQLYPTKAGEFMFKRFEGIKDFTMNTAKSGLSVGEKTTIWLYNKVRSWSKRWFTHIFLFLVVLTYSVVGATIFVAVEGTNEEAERADVHNERSSMLQDLRRLALDPQYIDPEEWEGAAINHMMQFEERLYEAFKHGLIHEQTKVWSFWNAVFYCGTIYTTIGYGHIAPSTNTGRAITIVYAVFGIPLFLILLADFGKLFTRGIKFLWALVRRVYYTGSCRKVRRTARVQEVMKGVQLVYDFATFQRRPSQMKTAEEELQGDEDHREAQVPLQQPPGTPHLSVDGLEPGTPAPSNYEIDDEFNLPISVAIVILVIYIFVGATIYWLWETWGFFEAFYFVFISMSTIGFGDFVPEHPMYMMASIVYLVFGLALTSMCINVVQEKLSDSFRQASAKIGRTIGLQVADEDGNVTPLQVELPLEGLSRSESLNIQVNNSLLVPPPKSQST